MKAVHSFQEHAQMKTKIVLSILGSFCREVVRQLGPTVRKEGPTFPQLTGTQWQMFYKGTVSGLLSPLQDGEMG